jgi:hypothetical protein
MVKLSIRSPRAEASALRRRHRARILESLLQVCEEIARLQVSREARLACREVAALLRSALVREAMPGFRSRK